MIPLGPVVARSRTKASRAMVWAYLTDPSLRAQWWEPLQFDAGLGGSVQAQRVGANADGEDADAESLSRDLVGAVDVWVAGHALGFSWKTEDEERGTAVLVTLRSQGYHTGVTVTETGFDALREGAARAAEAGYDWSRFVDALAEASLVEVDLDARAAVAEGQSENTAGAGAGAGAAAGVAAGVVGAVAADAAPTADDAAAEVAANDAADNTAIDAADDSAISAEAQAAAEAAELELAPLEIDGELAEDDENLLAEAAVEVEAEPAVGDHLELVTGPIAVQAPEFFHAAVVEKERVPVRTDDAPEDEGLVPLVLPGPPTESASSAQPHPDSLLEKTAVLEEPVVVGDTAAASGREDIEDAVVVEEIIIEDAVVLPAADENAADGDDDDDNAEPDFDSLIRGL
ncbi:uncharacterized protein YndB with AHSA1/START domain [Leucobacter exalbidus]|uniref:Uncharacterized protein YndB with AHSA1/START domain n=1 Tax=Leucobacter exalbidus TaxID=662960 RepID=A0A940PVK8_9MICO|nr:SRPBCC domain-containing protein [Leucobacter exalbidus]MBP1327035.1 uncharacterized protein YndB with AHSA1/START domain [Leucobacter exalbidus]